MTSNNGQRVAVLCVSVLAAATWGGRKDRSLLDQLFDYAEETIRDQIVSWEKANGDDFWEANQIGAELEGGQFVSYLTGAMVHNLQSVRFIVTRADAPSDLTFAVVTATVQPSLVDETDFRYALIAAVTHWVNETSEGGQAWLATAQDYNVGDLAMLCQPGTLTSYLAQRGIYDLAITIGIEGHLCNDWMFDSVLVDKDEVAATGDKTEAEEGGDE